jgi:hypothetical protein
VDPRTGLHDVEKRKFLTLPGLELKPLSLPGHSQSLSCVGFEVFTAVVMKSIIFWDMLATWLLAGLLNLFLRP